MDDSISRLSTSFMFIVPTTSRKNKQTLISCSLISSQLVRTLQLFTCLLRRPWRLHGDFSVFYDKHLHPATSGMMNGLATFSMTKAVHQSCTQEKGHILDWLLLHTYGDHACTLCGLFPCHTPSPLTMPALSATSTSPFLARDLRTSIMKTKCPRYRPRCPESRPGHVHVSPTCTAPALMTWTLLTMDLYIPVYM